MNFEFHQKNNKIYNYSLFKKQLKFNFKKIEFRYVYI